MKAKNLLGMSALIAALGGAVEPVAPPLPRSNGSMHRWPERKLAKVRRSNRRKTVRRKPLRYSVQ